MDLIQQYADSDDDNIESTTLNNTITNTNTTTTNSTTTTSINLTPANNISAVAVIATNSSASSQSHNNIISPYDSKITYNAKAEDLYAPVYGPARPFAKGDAISHPNSNITGASVEGYHMNDFIFNQSMYGNTMVANQQYNNNKKKNKKNKRSRTVGNDTNDLSRPWATFEDQADSDVAIQGFSEDAFITIHENENEEEAENAQLKRIEEQMEEEKRRKQQQIEEEQEEQRKKKKGKMKELDEKSVITTGDDGETVEEGAGGYSIFHLKEERDYQGRTFMNHPSHIKPKTYRDIKSFIPKKWIHTFTGHTKAVTAIKFFPTYGHLLLSSSMDGTVRIWGTEENQRVCIRTYLGHKKAIRGLSFNHDGTRFATSSYDKTVKLWDTETGKVIGTYSNGSIPFCVEINPSESMSHQMLAGCQNKKIVQWDTREKKIVQTYDRHMGAVNTITYLDNNRQFLSSSDDKSLRLWDYGIPVEKKIIADPYMHSIPFIGKHPNQKWLLGQSLDNHIYVYEEDHNGFRQYKKKLFKGHKISGYACQCGFSNDGKFVYSGDAQGNVWFWDWKTGNHLTTKKCHDSVTIGVAWHPLESSKMATASWDGTIKYWD